MGISLVSHRGFMDFFVAKGQVIFFRKKEIILVPTSLYSILVNSLFEAVAATLIWIESTWDLQMQTFYSRQILFSTFD